MFLEFNHSYCYNVQNIAEIYTTWILNNIPIMLL